jgi:hypothetical protein
MTRSTHRLLHIALSAVAGIGCLFVSERASVSNPDTLWTEAEARIGRPLTPMSYAGVARRTTRRAAVAGAAAGAAYYGSGCVQAVNAYGQMVYQCP